MDNLNVLLGSIAEEAETVNVQAAGKEILNWLTGNVEYFIDNHNKIFKLDLIIDQSTENIFPECKKLQDLYKKVPDDIVKDQDNNHNIDEVLKNLKDEEVALLKRIGDIRTQLDNIVANVHESINTEKDLLKQLFERMSFYYELRGVYKGEFIIEKIAGGVKIIEFKYDAFSVPVTIKKKQEQEENGEIVQNVISEKTYVIPEGFSLALEIAFSPVKRKATLF